MDDEENTASLPPLYGFEWNQVVNDEPEPAKESIERGLLTIFILHEEKLRPIGTGFVISSSANRAVAVSAAHVFSEVRRLQSPPSRAHRSALAEFLPPVRPVDIDRKGIRAISINGEHIEVAIFDGLAFDEGTDLAVMSLTVQDEGGPGFAHQFLLDDAVPAIGDMVCIASYAGMSAEDEPALAGQLRFKLARRPMIRIGRVLAVHLEGTRLCRGPCIETSIPVYSGMSGGPAFRFDTTGPMRVFGLVCSDPDVDTLAKEDRSVAGRSIVALLPTSIQRDPDGGQTVGFAMSTQNAVGVFSPDYIKDQGQG